MGLLINKKQYQFLKDIDPPLSWKYLEPYLNDLSNRTLNSEAGLLEWLRDKSELEAFLEEKYAWRYIRMTTDTANQDYLTDFLFFAKEIEPKLAPYTDIFNRKLLSCPFVEKLDHAPYSVLLKKTRRQIEVYKEDNIPLFTELQLKQQQFASISGAMSVEIEGIEYTLEQASTFLKKTERSSREGVFNKIVHRRLQDTESLDTLLDTLLHLRHRVASNAGFEDFRGYSFAALNRFDYSVQDTLDFHQSIEREIVPILKRLSAYRQEKLGLDILRPWDMEVDISGSEPLTPFHGGADLISKSSEVLRRLDPFFGDCLDYMNTHHLFDVESRKGKAPGGYNFPLAESGAPFIFMNAADSFHDVTTLLHEGGHAIHTFLNRDLELNDFKQLPSEVAELASMSMELISMQHWDVFFQDPFDLKRAKRDQLIGVLKTLPWVATIDSFQHWLYSHPGHSRQERMEAWNSCFERFGAGFSHWEGFEDYRSILWQKQLHIFEVPFYYIEYAIAGLGAIALWKNFKKEPEGTIKRYKKALSLGYTRSIREIYAEAGVAFDFSVAYIHQLANFINEELEALM